MFLISSFDIIDIIKYKEGECLVKKTTIVLFSILLIIGIVSGCTNKNANTNLMTGKSELEQRAIINSFNKLIQDGSNEKDVINFIKQNIASVSKENASTLVLGLEDLQKQKLAEEQKYFEGDKNAKPIISEEILKKAQKEIQGSFSMDMISNIKDVQLRNGLNDIKDRGYRIIAPEGMYNAVIDYNMYKQFESFVTLDIKDYIDILAVETDKRTQEDAALIISADQLLNRAISCESFIKKYPLSKRIKAVKDLCSTYLTYYLYGLNNTPAFNYQNKELIQNFKESYDKVMLNSTNSRIIKGLQQYIKVIVKNNYKLNDQVEKSRKDVVRSINKELQLEVK